MLRAHRGRAYRVEPDWNVTKANDDRLHADDCGIAAECLRIFNFRLTNRGFPANGAAPRGWSRKAVHGWGRVDGLRGGRCKYVHVSSVAASMRLTPLRSPSTRPRTSSVRVHPRRRKRRSKAKAAWRVASLLWVEPKAAAGAAANVAHGDGPKGAGQDDRHSHARLSSKRSARPACDLLFLLRGWQTTEICQRAVGLGMRGCQPHGCGCQASRDGFTASPAYPTRPAHPRLLLSATHPTHEGLRRWLETS